MAESINNGGPAFPITITRDPDGGIFDPRGYGAEGMTLRDYFAAKALPFVIGWTTISSVPQNLAFDATAAAKAAYALADAMLKERNKIGGAS